MEETNLSRIKEIEKLLQKIKNSCAAKTAKPAYLPSRRDTLSVSRPSTTKNARKLPKLLLSTITWKYTTFSRQIQDKFLLRKK
jgi:hypothetical protein